MCLPSDYKPTPTLVPDYAERIRRSPHAGVAKKHMTCAEISRRIKLKQLRAARRAYADYCMVRGVQP
jgi:hypothetical protein